MYYFFDVIDMITIFIVELFITIVTWTILKFSIFKRQMKKRFHANMNKTLLINDELNNEKLLAHKNRKKPEWVKQEVIKIKSYCPQLSCRLIAEVFNKRYEGHRQRSESISKSWVANTVKNHLYEIQVMRRNIKSKPAHKIPFNKVWGMDLTFINQQPILGVVEHHSMNALILKKLKNKTSITILRALLDILENNPKPEFIRTDNELCFNSKLIKFGLWFLGIKKQTIDKHSPWQNGRIERFFGTLKATLKILPTEFKTKEEIPYLLQNFQWWYNNVRMHQNLSYQTPEQIYCQQERLYQQKE